MKEMIIPLQPYQDNKISDLRFLAENGKLLNNRLKWEPH